MDQQPIMEENMRAIFGLLLAFLIGLPHQVLAQAAPEKEEKPVFEEHKPFLDDLYALMKKHPEASRRFVIGDKTRLKGISQSPKPTADPRWLCCDDPPMPPQCIFLCPL